MPVVQGDATEHRSADQLPAHGDVVMSASRRKGTSWESAIVAYLQHRGWLFAERRALNGNKDRGDVAGIPGVVIEAKSVKTITLAAFVDEATVEAVNDGADLGVAWIKRRGKSSPADGFVVMSGETFTWLLHSAGYGNDSQKDSA